MGLLDFLFGLGGSERDSRSASVHSRNPRERAAAREEAAEALSSVADSGSKLRALRTLREKATLAVLDGWADAVFAALDDPDADVSLESARLIEDCTSHGIMASGGISAVAMMPEDAERIADRIEQVVGSIRHPSTVSRLNSTRRKLVAFAQQKG